MQSNKKGYRQRFKTDQEGRFILNSGAKVSNDQALLQGLGSDQLIEDEDGSYFGTGETKSNHQMIYGAKLYE